MGSGRHFKPVNFQRLRTGDGLHFTEQTVDAMIETAEQSRLHQMGSSDTDSPEYSFEGSVIQVQNYSGSDLDRFGIGGLDVPVFLPSANLLEFQNYPRFKLMPPEFPTHDGRFCITVEPIGNGRVGRALLSGVVAAQVYVTTGLEWYDHADITHGSAVYLTLLPSGAAQVLWKEAGAGLVWAIVRVGNPLGNVSKWGVLDGALVKGGMATVSIWDGDPLADTTNDVTAYDNLLATGEQLNEGSGVLVKWFPKCRKWYVTEAGCAVAG